MTGTVAEAAIDDSGRAKADAAAKLAPVYRKNRRRDIYDLESIVFSFLILIGASSHLPLKDHYVFT